MVIRTHDNLIINCVLHGYAVTADPGGKQSKWEPSKGRNTLKALNYFQIPNYAYNVCFAPSWTARFSFFK